MKFRSQLAVPELSDVQDTLNDFSPFRPLPQQPHQFSIPDQVTKITQGFRGQGNTQQTLQRFLNTEDL